MGDARSLTPLSQADYEAIEAAVLETSRGRWFMAEYAKRNRQADTLQLLDSIQRIERVVGLSAQETGRDDNLIEAAELIGDLRADLERVSGKADPQGSGLAVQIANAADSIVAATENIQEAAWELREAGAAEALCDRLDRRSTEISAAAGIVDGLVQRIDKIADTIAMLDTSLRAFGDLSREPGPILEAIETPADEGGARALAAAASHAAEDSDRVPFSLPESGGSLHINDHAPRESRIASVHLLDDDIVFDDDAPAMPRPLTAAATSEAGLREIDSLPADRKLAYFV
ncbi:hypothetical protein [Bosea sp. BH3]|uniref:hypothetical protein n=1 Tax=Bosea sp. BH3 TaxID=2871701 RepID=UPI0021CAED88|nr:hypothetical protein [Bosea sp. BH3]MCU4182298.1 hypothetical protein [Bosea sp. BH3]